MYNTVYHVYGKVIIANNSARHGGGVFSVHSTLYFYNNMTMIIYNTANNRGGGVFAQRSNILLYNDI